MSENTYAEDIARHHWYQSIDLGVGLTTPGETGDATERKLEMMALPQDMSNLSVLDIGCNEGFFAFESERRGASRVVALDKSKPAMDKFNLVKQILDSQVEFHNVILDEFKPGPQGKFDVVFFLSVFHHLRHPFATLDRVAELTKGCAVMEFVEAVPNDGTDPSALVRKLSKRGHLHILPTRKFLLEILGRAGFEKIEVMGDHRFHKIKEKRDMPGFDEQRVIVKGWK